MATRGNSALKSAFTRPKKGFGVGAQQRITEPGGNVPLPRPIPVTPPITPIVPAPIVPRGPEEPREPREPEIPAPPAWNSTGYNIKGAPSWWRGMVPGTLNPNTSYLGLINNLLPFMSHEDQASMAAALFRADPTNFGSYNPKKLDIKPGGLNSGQQDKFTSAQRAQNVMKALTAFAKATGKDTKDLGPGFLFLQSAADTLRDFGGTDLNGQTRAQYVQQQAALDPLFAQARSPQLAAYEPLLRALTSPFFSGGQLTPVTRATDGSWVFGTPQRGWF